MRAAVWGICALLAVQAGAQGRNEKELQGVRRQLDRGKVYPALRRCDGLMTRDMPKAPVLLLRAEALVRTRSYAAALEDAHAARATGLDDAGLGRSWFWEGMAWSGLQRGDSALEAFRRAPGGAERDLRMAMALAMGGRCEEAMPLYDALLAAGESPIARRERGACWSMLGDSARARADLERAIALDPGDPVNWNSRGFHRWARFGEHQRAIADYGQAIKLNPNYAYAFNNRGYSRLKLGQVEKARRDIELAGRRDPGNPYVDHHLGLLALAQGDSVRACGHFRAAERKGGTPLHGNELTDLLRACPTAPSPAPSPAEGPRPVPAPDKGPNIPSRNAPAGRNAP